MITLILSIGFSIEFSAHVTYGFVSNENSLTPRQRCIDTMEKLAWPSIFFIHIYNFYNSLTDKDLSSFNQVFKR